MEKSAILEQLFDKGYVINEFTLEPTKIKIKLKSLSVNDYFTIDSVMENVSGTKAFILQTFALEKLSRGLLKYKDKEFSTPEEAKEFLKSEQISAFLFEKLVKIQSKFEDDIKSALDIKEIEENFFDQQGSQEKQEQ